MLDAVDARREDHLIAVDAEITGYNVPATSFTAFTYPDPGDPTVIGIETVTSNEVLTDPDQVKPHIRLYDSLREAAMSVSDSRQFLVQAAEQLPAQ